jgi:hypothetical protein
MKSIKSRIVKLLTGVDLDTLKKKQSIVTGIPVGSGLNNGYLFDFKNFSSDYNQANQGGSIDIDSGVNPSTNTMGGFMMQDSKSTVLGKITIKPVDVLNELETVPDIISLTLIDEKIAICKDKETLIAQDYAKRELKAIIERLENRKKYAEHRSFFERYQNTTDEKIDVILSKYALVMKAADIFIPEFPNEAIESMKQYTAKMQLICAKKPVFYVIAEEKHFKKAYEKRDPILLVQSPFGFFWQILGAWDKEMILLSEL